MFRRFAYLQRARLKQDHPKTTFSLGRFLPNVPVDAISFQPSVFPWHSHPMEADLIQDKISSQLFRFKMARKREMQTERFASPPIFASALRVPAAGVPAAKMTPHMIRYRRNLPKRKSREKNIFLAHAPPGAFSVSHVHSKTISGKGASIPSGGIASDGPYVERATMTKANTTRFSRAKDKGGGGTPLSLTHPNPDIAQCHAAS